MIAVSGAPLEVFVVADRDYYPDLAQLLASLPMDHLQWHVWARTEIENYLLNVDGVLRVLGRPAPQVTLDEVALRAEIERLVDSSRNAANDKLVKAFQDFAQRTGERWDAVTLSRKAREFVDAHWDTDKTGLADAKDIVLPGLKRWLKERGIGQFSDVALAQAMRPEDLPEEVHALARLLARFAGVTP